MSETTRQVRLAGFLCAGSIDWRNCRKSAEVPGGIHPARRMGEGMRAALRQAGLCLHAAP